MQLSARSAARIRSARFKHWHKRGRIDVAAMQYNLTPLLNVEQMHRSLYPLRALRDEFGLKVESAMQDDVNGVSWLYRRPSRRARGLVLHRRHQPDSRRAAETVPWRVLVEGPSGKKCLPGTAITISSAAARPVSATGIWSSGCCRAGSSSSRSDPTYPFDFLYCESTHPVRVDNGPPDPRMPEFVKRWNNEDRPYKFQFVTTTEFGKLLRKRHGNAIGRQRGDWTDHWTDGPGSSAYDTSVNRNAHEILGMAETIEAWLRSRRRAAMGRRRRAARDIREHDALRRAYLGRLLLVEAPDSLFTRAQWNRKAGYAYAAIMEGARPAGVAPPARSRSRSASPDRKAFSISAT